MGSIKTTQYRKETVQTAHQMNMACILKKDSHSQKQAVGSRLDLALDSPWRLELRDGAYLLSSSSFLTRSFSSPIANTLYLQKRHKSMLV